MSESCTSEETDFSASEDEWVPKNNKSKKQSSSSESEYDNDFEHFAVKSTKYFVFYLFYFICILIFNIF